MARRRAVVLRLLAVPLLLLLWQLMLAPEVAAVWLNLPSSGTKCVSEEIQPNVVVLADYAVVHEKHTENFPTISVKVTSPYGTILHQKEHVTVDQFAFTTAESGNYLACFWIDSGDKGTGTSISLVWKIGIAAKDWDSLAKKEKIEGAELELTKLEGAVQAIHENLFYLKTKEAEMRAVNERTNARVAKYSMISLGLCIMVSILQLWHLKRFFRKKKLI